MYVVRTDDDPAAWRWQGYFLCTKDGLKAGFLRPTARSAYQYSIGVFDSLHALFKVEAPRLRFNKPSNDVYTRGGVHVVMYTWWYTSAVGVVGCERDEADGSGPMTYGGVE